MDLHGLPRSGSAHQEAPKIQGPVFGTDTEAFQAAILAKAKAEENGGKKLTLPARMKSASTARRRSCTSTKPAWWSTGRAEDSDGKTDAGWRAISLDDFTFEVICRYIDMLHKEAKDFGKGYANPAKLAVWPDGKLVHPDTLTRRFNQLVDLAGVPKIRLHDVRHAYVTLARILEVNRKNLADRVGHANETVTDIVYTHVSVGHDRELADKIGGAILEALKEAAGSELKGEPNSLSSGALARSMKISSKGGEYSHASFSSTRLPMHTSSPGTMVA